MIEVIRKPPKFKAVQWKGNNRNEVDCFIMVYDAPTWLSLEVSDWILLDDEGHHEIISDKEFHRLYERV